jgi:hypothetical protein
MTTLHNREILERTVRAIAHRARDAYRVVDEAHAVDPRDESGLVAAAKRLRMELLQTKAELEGTWPASGFTVDAASEASTGSAALVPSRDTGLTRSQHRTTTIRRLLRGHIPSRNRTQLCPSVGECSSSVF